MLSALTSPDLVEVLACPDCGGVLGDRGDKLECSTCRHEYGIDNGIPILYPSALDVSHLQGEQKLAGMMKTKKTGSRAQFSSKQWRESNKEFWSMVQDRLSPAPARIVNLGCGYDTNFKSFEDADYQFINFDIVCDMLQTLQNEHGARRCVAGDIGHLPFRDSAFDCLVCVDVIHHECDNLEVILRSFRKLLKPGGVLFLQDPNAWGMFQIWKSVMMPRPLHRFLRSTYHALKRSTHMPATYEFSTSVWAVKRLLTDIGFSKIVVHPNNAYPCIGPAGYRLYSPLARSGYFSRYHNYHYTLTAVRGDD